MLINTLCVMGQGHVLHAGALYALVGAVEILVGRLQPADVIVGVRDYVRLDSVCLAVAVQRALVEIKRDGV